MNKIIAFLLVVLIAISYFHVIRHGSWDHPKEISEKSKTESFHKGDIIKFGKYDRQDILWEVIRVDNQKIMLRSKKVIECKPYKKNKEDGAWKDSDLREWLNGIFYDYSFSDFEKQFMADIILFSDETTVTDKVVIPTFESSYDESARSYRATATEGAYEWIDTL